MALGSLSGLCVLQSTFPPALGAAPKDEVNQRPTARLVRVMDLERILAGDQGKSDAEVSRQLSGLSLTERMSDATLQSLEQHLPGPKSRWALVVLADDAVFLRPAAADVIAQAAPDLDGQRRIIAMTVDYLKETIPRLPDFYATRTTVRFRGSPKDASWLETGSAQEVVTYRDGKEVVRAHAGGVHPFKSKDNSLITKGVFGPILYTVIRDAAFGETVWERWERGTNGTTLAVFRYRVPQSQSHYSVAFHKRASATGEGELGTGYHGEFAIDPATGTILRLTVRADLPLGSPIMGADIMVQYGPVEIGGRTYTCPLRSVSVSLDAEGLMDALQGLDLAVSGPPDTILLNDVTFGSYHVFRSSAQILTGNVPADGRSDAGGQTPVE